jgi:hypothetical protein
LYSGGVGFESRPGHRVSWLRFLVVFLDPSRLRPVPSEFFTTRLLSTRRRCVFCIGSAETNYQNL